MNRLQHLAPIIASLLTFLHLLSFDVPASVVANLPSATFFHRQQEQLLARGANKLVIIGELKTALDDAENMVELDAREPNTFEVAHIPCADL